MRHRPSLLAAARRVSPAWFPLSLLLVTGGGCGGDGDAGDRTRGRSDFQTGEGGLPGSSAPGGERPGAGSSTGGPGSAPAPSIPPGMGNPDNVPSAPGQLIEEGDIVKLSGTTLYVLNEFRGLQIIDIANPAAPALLAKVPVLGAPEDMFVRGTTLIALVSNHVEYGACADCPGGARMFKGSLAAFIDVSNPRAPVERARKAVRGTITDSRIVGDTLFLVSQQYTFNHPSINDDGRNSTTVQAISLADTAKPVERSRLEIPRGGWQNHVHFTDKLLFLASSGAGQWTANDTCVVPVPTTAPMTGTGSSGGGPVTTAPAAPVPVPPPGMMPMSDKPTVGSPCSRIVAVDIAAPDALKVGAHADLPGRVMDRWSMDHHAGVLRVVSAPSWGSGIPRLVSFTAPNAIDIAPLGPGLDMPVPRPEELKAVRFDGTRAFVVTFMRIDPLFVLDLSDPAAPKKVGELETPGWVDFIEVRGDRLIALGHDMAATPMVGRGPWALSASIYDVADLSMPKLMSREIFGEGSATIPDSRDNWHKVFRVFDAAKLIVMPYRTFEAPNAGVPYARNMVGRVQLIDFDLPTGKLTKRGAVAHDGGLERALLSGTQVLAVSPSRLQIIDVADRDQPRTLGALTLTDDVREVVRVGADAVASVLDATSGRYRLHLVAGVDPNAAPQATLDLPLEDARMFASGGLVHVIGREFVVQPGAAPGKESTVSQHLRLVVVEVAAGMLRKRGELALPANVRSFDFDEGTKYGNAPTSIALVGNQALVFRVPREGGCGGTPGTRPPSPNVPVDPPPVPGGTSGSTGPGATPAMPPVQDAGVVDVSPAMPPAQDAGMPSDAGAAADAGGATMPRAIAQVTCPPHEADFLVVDVRNPDAPAVASKFVIAGAADVIGAGSAGNDFFVDHYEEVPGLDQNNRVIVAAIRYFVTRVDLGNPAAPKLGPKINVPGMFVRERSADRTWFTLEPRRTTQGRSEVYLDVLYQPAGRDKAYLEGSLLLPGGESGPSGSLLFGDAAAFGVFRGLLVSMDLSDNEKPRVVAETRIPGVQPSADGGGVAVGGAGPVAPGERPVSFSSGWASARALVGDRLVLGVEGGALVYDVKDPAKPALLGFARGAGTNGRVHAPAGAERALLPAGQYGVATLPTTLPPAPPEQ